MKVRNYEKYEIISIMLIFLFILELTTLFYVTNKKIFIYRNMTGIYLKKDLIELIVSKSDRKIIYKNSNVYIDNKKRIYKMIEDRGVITNQNGKEYYDLVIKVGTDKKSKVRDTITLVWQDKKINLVEMFKSIWEGD